MQNSSPAIPRLGIKPYDWWSEALHGIARNGNATVFPQAIGMAASFDAALLFKVFDAASDEARVKYRQASSQNKFGRYQGLTVWTPNINIFRDPRWGRGQETYGEDPFLTGVMGQAVVRGLQGMPKKVMISLMRVPSILPFIVDLNRLDISSTLKIFHHVIYGKHTYRLSKI